MTARRPVVLVGGAWQELKDADQLKNVMHISVYDPDELGRTGFVDREHHTGTQLLDTISDAGTAAAEDMGNLGEANKVAWADHIHDNPVMEGASATEGAKGLVPAQPPESALHFLRGDGEWAEVDLSEFTGALGDGEDGIKGLVPAPLDGDEKKLLRGDGTWTKQKPPSRVRKFYGSYI